MRLFRGLLGRLGKSAEFEARYLKENTDVHNAVAEGLFKTGHEHYLLRRKFGVGKLGERQSPIHELEVWN